MEPEDFVNKLFNGDNLEILKEIPDETFDFCFADPPYFMQLAERKKLLRADGNVFNGCTDEWDKFKDMSDYISFTKKWLSAVRHKLKKNGAICVIGSMQSIHEIGAAMRELGFNILSDITWKKSNPTPNFTGSRLNNSSETIIWAAKSKTSRVTFNYQTAKYINGGKQLGSVWEFPICGGRERLKDENGNKLHSAQKPLALLERIVVLFTKPGDLVLDPFAGTMTTAVAAKKLGRRYTMIELGEKYFHYGEQRVAATKEKMDEVARAKFDEKPMKITIKMMVDTGLLHIDDKFVNKEGDAATLINDRGWLAYNGYVDSMHAIAGTMTGTRPRANAFEYFYVVRGDKKILLDDLREECRKKMLAQQNKVNKNKQKD